MRRGRGSFKRRLPRGRLHRRKIHPALLGAAIFLVLLVPAFFYLMPHAPSSNSDIPIFNIPTDNPSSEASDASNAPSAPADLPGQVLKIASSEQEPIESGLIATVKSSGQNATQVYLENTGQSPLERVKVLGENGKALGILSMLSPGEKKVLAMSGPVRGIKINAFDPAGREVLGEINYEEPMAPTSFSGSLGGGTVQDVKPQDVKPQDIKLGTQATATANPEAPIAPAPEVPCTPAISQSPIKTPKGPRLSIIITINRSEGHEGDAAGYRCNAKNCGEEELSDVKMFCEGKIASTKFLTPGKEIHLDGIHVIHDNFQLSAGVQGKDASGRICTNNTSTEIWKLSPQLKVNVSGPETVHRGERVALEVTMENAGNAPLSNLTIADASGEIGKIPRLEPGETKALQREMELDETLQEDVKAVALDSSGGEVYASRGMEIRVLNSGLEISGQPSIVTVYPGQPAEVTWDLRNTGEETLRNITLSGEDGKKCMLKELSPGRSVRMAAVYTLDCISWINVTAQGSDPGGYSAIAHGSVLVKAIQPGISLKVTPERVEVCPGEEANVSCLITNAGDDDLQEIILYQQGTVLATLDRLAPGDFRVVDTRTAIPDNTTLNFDVQCKDSRGQGWSDSAEVDANVVITSLKVFASASPQSVIPGNATRITCTVANTGSIPLYSVFVISKAFGPLGSIDFLPSKRQKTICAEKTISDAVVDSISAEGFTQERNSVRSSCQLNIEVLRLTGREMEIKPQAQSEAAEADAPDGIEIKSVKVRCGDMNIPLSLPSENETAVRISQEIAEGVDSSAKESGNQVLDGISRFLGYIQKVLERVGGQKTDEQNAGEREIELEASASQELEVPPEGDEDADASRNYELSIEGVKGSEHGAIRIMDVSAVPSQPAAWEQVKVSVHVKSSIGVKAVSARWGLSDAPLTKSDMLGVNRVYDMPMTLESGDGRDGYWSGILPGKAAGTYMALSVWLTDGSATAEGGPYMLHWSTINSKDAAEGDGKGAHAAGSQLEEGMLFIESSTVKGKGEVSIKDTFHGSAMEFNEKMKGNGSISLESLRCVDKRTADNFTEKKDLVFTDGQLKGQQRVSSPTFHGGLGASVTERFNLSHVDKSETSSVSSADFANNTLAFNTDQAFDGTWNIQTQYAKFYKKIKADQQYTGSFQTQKKIKFQDYGQK
jgi:hypothetical protein